jgi:uncharacterized repeat protein (TIGR03803 family)
MPILSSTQRWGRRKIRLLVVATVLVCAANPVSAQTFTVLHTFAGAPDGSSPFGGLVADRNGNYYGTTQFDGTSDGGTVFELSPPAESGGEWTETVIWNFARGADGEEPSFQLVMDGEGNLYGETQSGGNPKCGCGTVFVLARPKTPGGKWTKRVIYTPTGGSGAVLYGGLALDSTGAVYGTQFIRGTFNRGLAFKITPTTGGGFMETTLYNFGATTTDSAEPFGPVTLDSNGNLYGVSKGGGTNNLGTAYKLTPPSTGTGLWSNSVLYSFATGDPGCNPEGNVVLDKAGRLYGQTTSCGGTANNGVIFRLTPSAESGTPWTESILHTFSTTDGGGLFPSLSFNTKTETLYGTSFYGGGAGGANGLVFQLTPPAGGAGAWTETVLYTFGSSNGGGPLGPLVWDANGVLYGTAYGLSGDGTIFSIAP